MAACATVEILDSKGKEFILGILSCTANPPDDCKPVKNLNPILLITTNSKLPAIVRVTAPLHDPFFLVREVVSRTRSLHVYLPSSLRPVRETNMQSPFQISKGHLAVWIRSNFDITVHVYNAQIRNSEAYLALPLDVLGTTYRLVTWSGHPELLVVATQNDTKVDIRRREQEVSSMSGKDLVATTRLHKFQTFSVYSATGTETDDWTGYRVVADKPIAVVCGNEKTNVGGGQRGDIKTHLEEMLYPVQNWGREFLTFSTPHRGPGDWLKLVASQYNTDVTLIPLLDTPPEKNNSSTSNTEPSLQTRFFLEFPGDHEVVNLKPGPYYVVAADKPILVAEFASSHGLTPEGLPEEHGSAAMTLLSPFPHYDTSFTWVTPRPIQSYTFADLNISEHHRYTRTNFTNYLCVMVKSDDAPDIRLNGRTIRWTRGLKYSSKGSFKLQLSVVWLRVDSGYHRITQKARNLAEPLFAVATGMLRAGQDRHFLAYSFPTGMRLGRINDDQCGSRHETVKPADGLNNDCDNFTDEEFVDGFDNDGDGEVDEDIMMYPVHGNWSPWVNGTCSKTCGEGFRTRSRRCDQPPPFFGGRDCVGIHTMTGVYCHTECSVLGQVKEGPGNWLARLTNPNVRYLVLGALAAIPILLIVIVAMLTVHTLMEPADEEGDGLGKLRKTEDGHDDSGIPRRYRPPRQPAARGPYYALSPRELLRIARQSQSSQQQMESDRPRYRRPWQSRRSRRSRWRPAPPRWRWPSTRTSRWRRRWLRRNRRQSH